MKKSFLIPLLVFSNLISYSIYAGETPIPFDQGHLSGRMDVTASSKNFNQTRAYELTLAKFLLAARKDMTLTVLKNRSALLALYKALSGLNAPYSSFPRELEREFTLEKFPDFNSERTQFEESALAEINKEYVEKMVEATITNSFLLSKLDATVFDLKFNEKVTKENKVMGASERNAEINYSNSIKEGILAKNGNGYLGIPEFSDFKSKRFYEFFLFPGRPVDRLYQRIFATISEQNLNENLKSSGEKKRSLDKLINLLNVIEFDPNDQGDSDYKIAKKLAPKLIEKISYTQLANAQSKGVFPYSQTEKALVRQILAAKVLEILESSNVALDYLKKDISSREVFIGDGKKFFKHYASLFAITALQERVASTYAVVEPTFSIYLLKRCLDDLKALNIVQEEKDNSQTLNYLLYGAGALSIFLPYGRVISPSILVTTSIKSIFFDSLPQMLRAESALDSYSSLADPFGLHKIEYSLDNQELLSRHSIYQNKRAQLAFSALLEGGLVLAPSAISLIKNRKLFTVAPRVAVRVRDMGYRAWLRQMNVSLPSGGKKLAALASIGKGIIKDSNVQVTLSYFVTITSLQVIFDKFGVGYGGKWPKMEMPNPEKSLKKTDAEAYEKNHYAEMVRFKASLTNHFFNKDKELNYPYMKPLYSRKMKYELYDGDRVIKVFETIYLPVNKVASVIEKKANLTEIAKEVVHSFVIQSVIESDLYNAFFDETFTIYALKYMYSENPEEDNELKIYGDAVSFIAKQKTEKEIKLSATLESITAEAIMLSELYSVAGSKR